MWLANDRSCGLLYQNVQSQSHSDVICLPHLLGHSRLALPIFNVWGWHSMSERMSTVTELQSKKTPEDGLGKITTSYLTGDNRPPEDACWHGRGLTSPTFSHRFSTKNGNSGKPNNCSMLLKFVLFFNFQKVSKSSNLLSLLKLFQKVHLMVNCLGYDL